MAMNEQKPQGKRFAVDLGDPPNSRANYEKYQEIGRGRGSKFYRGTEEEGGF